MEEKLDFSKVPYQYPLCLNRQCPEAATCLRQVAERNATDDLKYWTILSPRYLASLERDCPHYRSSKKIRYAKGFIGILESLPYKQMQEVISSLMTHFGRRTYYRIRKGERPLSPSEQRDLLAILKQRGVAHPKEFDAYYEDYNWE